MTPSSQASNAQVAYQLHFQSLVRARVACDFPCDAAGHVDMDALEERVLTSYLYARAVIGCEFALPVVQPCVLN
jgi:hypothetical protein